MNKTIRLEQSEIKLLKKTVRAILKKNMELTKGTSKYGNECYLDSTSSSYDRNSEDKIWNITFQFKPYRRNAWSFDGAYEIANNWKESTIKQFQEELNKAGIKFYNSGVHFMFTIIKVRNR